MEPSVFNHVPDCPHCRAILASHDGPVDFLSDDVAALAIIEHFIEVRDRKGDLTNGG